MNNTKQIFIAMAMFVMMWGATNAHAQTKQEDIYNLDCQIHNLRREITDIRAQNQKNIQRALRKNRNYRYVMYYAADVDSMRRMNKRLLDEACDKIRRNHPNTIIVNTPFIFIQYSSELSSSHALYNINRTHINLYEKAKAELNGFEQSVKNHFDSIMHSEIERRQLMMDSLLNEKYKLIR